MSGGYLLDTNVMSEPSRPEPDSGLMAFMSGRADGYVSAITVHELRFGLESMLDGKRREHLMMSVERLLASYRDRIIPLGSAEARAAATLRREAKAGGRVLHLADALLAGTAQVHCLTLATRNVADFETLGLSLHNPWSD